MGRVDLDPNGKTATVFIVEYIPGGPPTPRQTTVGRCDWRDRYSREDTVNSLLKAKAYPTDRYMTQPEFEEVRQAMR